MGAKGDRERRVLSEYNKETVDVERKKHTHRDRESDKDRNIGVRKPKQISENTLCMHNECIMVLDKAAPL